MLYHRSRTRTDYLASIDGLFLISFGEGMIAYVCQILEGIRFLRNVGRTLATLTTRDILFTESGGVKISTLDFHPLMNIDAHTNQLGSKKAA